MKKTDEKCPDQPVCIDGNNVAVAVPDVDNLNWKEWAALTPGERLQQASDLWVETYAIREQSEQFLQRAITRAFGKAPQE